MADFLFLPESCQNDLLFDLEIRIFAPEMPQLIYKRVTGKDGVRRYTPYEIFTQEEAAERGIEPLSRMDWRKRFFQNHEDLTGQYILTDDTPSLVAPVLRCQISDPTRYRGRGGYIKKLFLPWTFVTGIRSIVLVGVRVGVISQQWKALYGRVTTNQRKLFILLVALGCGHHKAIFAIWGLDQKVDQNYFRKLIMSDEKTEQAMSELARDVFTEAGADPVAIAKKLWNFVQDEKLPADMRIGLAERIADRVGLDDREEKPSSGVGIFGMLQEGPAHPQVTADMARAIAAKSGDGGKAVALIESQGEVVPDE